MGSLPDRSRRRPLVRQPRSGGLSRRIVRDAASMGESARLFGFALLEVVAAVRAGAGVLLSALGLPGLGGALRQVRWNAENQRAWASRTGDRDVTSNYGNVPEVERGGMAELKANLTDPARARDLDWHLLNPLVGAASALAPGALALHGSFGFLNLFVASWSGASQEYFGFWVDAYYFGGGHVMVLLLAGGQIILAPPLARLLQRLHRRWVRFMLAGEESESLEERVRTLTATRMTALDMQDAEIRRIERDLHDGAQARLVTIGMTVTQASRLLRHDPDATLALLDDVKQDSVVALEELRALVRGIRPPVLADRGLPDALRALAASNPIDAEVRSNLEGRLVGSVESALFFAVSELMANATKHSSAGRVLVELSEEAGDVVVEVSDDGLGGAEGRELPDGGLAGVRRRLAPFDGTLDIVSPVGGGTFATVRVPRTEG